MITCEVSRAQVASFEEHMKLGAYHLEHNAPGRAANEFEQAAHIDPNSPETLYNLGAALRLWGDLNGATDALSRALRLKPHFPEAHFVLGLVLGDRVGGERRGLAEFEAAAAEDPSFAEANFNIGVIHWKANEFEQAVDPLRKAVAKRPDSALFRFRYGQALAKTGQLQDAVKQFERATRIDPTYREAYYQLALVQRQLGEKDAARGTMEIVNRLQRVGSTAAEIDQSQLAYTQGVGALERGDPDAAIEKLTQALNGTRNELLIRNALGIAHQRKGDNAAAIGEFRKVIHEDPKSLDGHLNLGVALMNSGNATEAEQKFRAVLRLDPEFAEAYYNLGLVMAGQGRWKSAIDFLLQYLRLRPDSGRGYWNLARVLRDAGKTDDALRNFQIAWGMDKSLTKAAFEYGQLLGTQNRLEEALAIWKEALQRKPIDSRLHEAYVAALQEKGRYEEAEQEHRKFRFLSGVNVPPHSCAYQRGISYLDRSEFDKGIQCFRKILDVEPDLSAVRRKLALALHAKGDSDAAAKEYQKLVANDPNDSQLRLDLGVVLISKGSLETAKRELNHVVRLNPQSAVAHYQLGMVHLGQNDSTLAMQEFRSARRIDPRIELPTLGTVPRPRERILPGTETGKTRR